MKYIFINKQGIIIILWVLSLYIKYSDLEPIDRINIYTYLYVYNSI